MKTFVKILLREGLIKEEYQVRNIDGPVYYKRFNKDSKWFFISENEFFDNKGDNNVIFFNS
jgi:hypothetical protein